MKLLQDPREITIASVRLSIMKPKQPQLTRRRFLGATLASAGAILFPPMPAFYGRPQSLEEVISATVGRALFRLGIDNPAYTRWQGP